MYVQFEFTEADLVDAAKRLLGRYKSPSAGSWIAPIYYCVVVGAIIFLFLQNNPAKGLLAGLIAAGLTILLYPKLQKGSVDRRLHRIAAGLMAEPGPYVCEVELRPEGVWVRQMNKQIIYEWKLVEAIEEMDDSVTIFARYGEGVVVRNRAFKAENERNRFLEIARSSVGRDQNN
jgi:hypothetical protein